MARMLRGALASGGDDVALVSDLRSYCGDPDNTELAADIADRAASERLRIAASWAQKAPALWVSYHPYYKSPDLIGPALCRDFGVPYVTIESSYSARRNIRLWASSQAAVQQGLTQAAVNICLTARDRAGILAAVPDARLADLPPFIDPTLCLGARGYHSGPVRLIAVAMMRAGDKFDSYTMLAAALTGLYTLDWRLTIIGTGAMEPAVHALFAPLHDKVDWAGQCTPAQVADHLLQSDVYVWPGYGEAYGLAYLEAQAAGLPVVAQRVAGVPEVVTETRGLLTPPGDVPAYRAAIASLITDAVLRQRLGQAARTEVLARHSFQAASARLQGILAAAEKVKA